MKLRWSLDELYGSFETDGFKKDLEEFSYLIEEIRSWSEIHLVSDPHELPPEQRVQIIEEYLEKIEQFHRIFSKLYNYSELTLSVDVKNETALRVMENLQEGITELAAPETRFAKWLGSLENLPEIIHRSSLLTDHQLYLTETARESKFLLSESEEVLIAKMKNTGSEAWAKLQQVLTSTLTAEFTDDGATVSREVPLSVIRSFAHDRDAGKRKAAYEAEIKSYRKVEEASAACLNGIKGEVLTVTKMRGYQSPLEEALINNRIDSETLQAMFAAVEESLPEFHKFLLKKAELLGAKNGLPFYDLYAPVGEMRSQFTYDEARDFLVTQFGTFSARLSDLAARAFADHWIDAEPREGKGGGAFCAHLYTLKQSRILCNFMGNYDDITTLAHELGHAYHGECLNQATYLNSEYPMSIAETASIFCETIIKEAALKKATPGESIAILENDLSSCSAIVVDIYSRFLFESQLFEKRKTASLSVAELKELMLDSQKKAYGAGLDQRFLHPYMWLNKPHYYDADHNFYNFPYTFGLLFAKGLYREYVRKGASFVAEYEHLLSESGKYTVTEIASGAGIDIQDIKFWRGSLQVIKEDIAKFMALNS